jgi:DNA-binding transcriptional LysR family regulator
MQKPAKPPGYSLRQLAYFVAVAECDTLSTAADRQHVSQSAVFVGQTDLEHALRTQLCVRRKAHGITSRRLGERVHSGAVGIARGPRAADDGGEERGARGREAVREGHGVAEAARDPDRLTRAY